METHIGLQNTLVVWSDVHHVVLSPSGREPNANSVRRPYGKKFSAARFRDRVTNHAIGLMRSHAGLNPFQARLQPRKRRIVKGA
jgi:hypothetical protein